MAEVVESFPARQPSATVLPPEWSDGRIWRIKHGEDFRCSVHSMRGTLGSYASRNGLHLKSTTRGVPAGVIVFQFLPKEGAL